MCISVCAVNVYPETRCVHIIECKFRGAFTEQPPEGAPFRHLHTDASVYAQMISVCLRVKEKTEKEFLQHKSSIMKPD